MHLELWHTQVDSRQRSIQVPSLLCASCIDAVEKWKRGGGWREGEQEGRGRKRKGDRPLQSGEAEARRRGAALLWSVQSRASWLFFLHAFPLNPASLMLLPPLKCRRLQGHAARPSRSWRNYVFFFLFFCAHMWANAGRSCSGPRHLELMSQTMSRESRNKPLTCAGIDSMPLPRHPAFATFAKSGRRARVGDGRGVLLGFGREDR